MTVTIRTTVLSTAGDNRAATKMGLGCMGLVLLPFLAVGLFNLGNGILQVISGNWREGLMLALFGAVFAGFPAAFGAVILVGLRHQKELAGLKAKCPDQPWLWRRDWASGRIEDGNRYTGRVLWIFAALWNLISVPMALAGVQEALRDQNALLFLVLLFPAVGVGLLLWAVRATLRSRRYGRSRLELESIPGAIGRSLVGTVRLNAVVQPAEGFEATLSCVRRVTTGSGKSSSTTEHILWQEERRITGSAGRDAPGMGTRIPVAFRLPADSLASDATDSRNQVVWRLTVAADVPGIDYAASFEVPVFRTAESDLPPTEQELKLGAEAARAVADYRPSSDSRVTVTTNRRGTEIYFPAARNPGVAIGATVFTLLWTGVVFGIVYAGAPLVFPFVFGALGLLLVMGTLQLWLGVSRVTADGATLLIEDGYLYPTRQRRVVKAEIGDVVTRIGMQAGTKPYYDVVVQRKDGKKLIAGRGLRDKREAEWLAFKLKTAAGAGSS